METASQELAIWNAIKTDFESADNQIVINDKFKEITSINTPIGLVRWTSLPFGLKT